MFTMLGWIICVSIVVFGTVAVVRIMANHDLKIEEGKRIERNAHLINTQIKAREIDRRNY